MHLIPFTVTIPADKRDEQLPEKLKRGMAGHPAMDDRRLPRVAWASGLAQPEAVRAGPRTITSPAEDAIAAWITEACTSKPQDSARSSALFRSWSLWATAAGEFVGSQRRFSQKLTDRGFVKRHGRDGWTFQGIAPISEPSAGPWWEGNL